MPRDTNSLILQLYARTPAPCRDYCGLTITTNEVVLNIWNITYGPHVYPKRQRCPMENLENDKFMQSEILRLFGDHVLKYTLSISMQERKLENLPSKIFLKILNHAAARDVINLSQTSKMLFELCNTDNMWRLLFRKYLRKQPDAQDMIYAERFGWKGTLIQTLHKKNKESSKLHLALSKTTISQKISYSNFKIGDNAMSKNRKVVANSKQTNKDAKLLPQNITANLGLKKVPNLTKIEQHLLIEPKINSTKSSSALNANNDKNKAKSINQAKSVANLTNKSRYVHVHQVPKTNIKVNNVTTLKNPDIKVEVSMELQNSAACMKNNATSSKNLHTTSKYQTIPVKANTVNVAALKNANVKLEVPVVYRKNSTVDNKKLTSSSSRLKISKNNLPTTRTTSSVLKK